jgi:hypothetical protein
MSSHNLALYRVLTKLGVDETEAALATTLDAASLLTKADLAEFRAATRADLAELKADIIQWNVVTLVALTAIYGGLVTVLKLFG